MIARCTPYPLNSSRSANMSIRSIELNGHELKTQQRPAILSAQHAASTGPLAGQADPSITVKPRGPTRVGHEGFKEKPKLGKYPGA